MMSFREVVLVVLLLGFLYSADAAAAADADTVGEEEPLKAYTETSDGTYLDTYIAERDFKGALDRLGESPEEAKILVESRNGRKVDGRALPLHRVFHIDIPKNSGKATRGEMPEDQAELIMELIKINPLATGQKDFQQRLPLHLALLSPVPPPTKIIQAMLKVYPKSVRIQGQHNSLPLHMAVTYPMTSFGNVQAIYEAYPNAIEIQDEDESLPLHLAVWGGDFEDSLKVVQFLTEKNPHHLNVKDGDQETPLALIAKYGRTSQDVARFVLDQDPKAIYRDISERERDTMLHHIITSSFQQNTTVYKPFVERHKDLVKKINRIGRLPLHLALVKCCAASDMVHSLLDVYPQGAANRDGIGMLPLHHACHAGVKDVSIVERLIELKPETVKIGSGEKRDRDGSLPLHLALEHPEQDGELHDKMNDVIRILLNEYPDAAKIPDPDSDVLPLHSAIMTKRPAAIIKRLLDLTPEAVGQKLNMVENDRKKTTTALHLFASIAHTYLNGEDIKQVIKEFAKIDAEAFKRKDSDGRIPLHGVWLEMQPIVKSREALYTALLDVYPEGAKVLDKSQKPPLTYSTLARDARGFDKLLELHPDAVKQASTDGFFPLHQLCDFGARGQYTENVHHMMEVLLERYPEAAAEFTEDGELPLHKLTKSIGIDFIKKETIELLIQAHPLALKMSDVHNCLPLHDIVGNAVTSHAAAQHPYWQDAFDVIFDAFPQASSRRLGRVKYPLAIAFDQADSLSMHRRSDEDLMLDIVQRLYNENPDAIYEVTKRMRSGLHSIVVLIGDMGGMTPVGWSDFGLRVIREYPRLLQSVDNHQRTPLHLLTLYLGDTAVGARDYQARDTRKVVPGLEQVYHELLLTYPEAMEERDEYNLTPLDMVLHRRLSITRGSKVYKSSPIIKMMKKNLRRGFPYWKARAEFRASTAGFDEGGVTCEGLGYMLAKVADDMKLLLKEHDVIAIGSVRYCAKNRSTLCDQCPQEAQMANLIEGNLATLTVKLDEASAALDAQ